jgi:hypothetical protein
MPDKDNSDARRKSRPKYTMSELLAQCDFNAPISKEQEEEDRIWLNMPSVGREL